MDLEQFGVMLQSTLSIINKYREDGCLHALDYRVETFCSVTLLNPPQGHRPSNRCRLVTHESTKDAGTQLFSA